MDRPVSFVFLPRWPLAAMIALMSSAGGVPSSFAQPTAPSVSDGSSSASRGERLAQEDQRLKDQIVRSPADSPQRVRLLGDRASIKLDGISVDGADMSVLVGVPTREQARRVRETAQQTLELMDQADTVCKRACAKYESMVVAHENVSEAEAQLHDLVDVQQRQRIPYLRSWARILLGATSTNQKEREAAQDAIRELKGISPGQPALERARKVALGLALIHAAELAPTEMARVQQIAGEQLAPIAAELKSDPQASGTGSGGGNVEGEHLLACIRARLGLLRLGQNVPDRLPLATPEFERELLILEVEASAGALVARSEAELGNRQALLARAISMLDLSAPMASLEASTWTKTSRALVLEKIAGLLPDAEDSASYPGVVALARAVTTSRTADPGDAKACDAAMQMLTNLLQRTDISKSLRMEACWERAVIAAKRGDALIEASAATEVVECEGDLIRRTLAARRVVELFQQQILKARPVNAAGQMAIAPKLPPEWTRRVGQLQSSLVLLMDIDQSKEELYRQDLVRSIVLQLAASERVDDLEQALKQTGRVGDMKDQPQAKDQLSQALWMLLDARRSAVFKLHSDRSKHAGESAFEALVPWTRASLAWIKKNAPEQEPAFTLVVGETLALAADGQSELILKPLGGSPLGLVTSPLYSRYRLALAESQHVSGQSAKALETLGQLADAVEGLPGQNNRPIAFWAAWTRILQIHIVLGHDRTDTDQLKLAIKRLELLDDRLGGSPYADQIRAIKQSLPASEPPKPVKTQPE